MHLFLQQVRTDFSATVALACIATLAVPAFAAGSSTPSSAEATATQGRYTKDQRILHTLNRFTFGPRPGDIAKVKAMGIDKWFEQQLTPESINDGALDDRLAEFPALQMTPEDLVRRYPNPNVIKRLAYNDKNDRGKRPSIPHDPVERAIWNDQIYWFRLTREEKAEKREEKSAPVNKQDNSDMADGMKPPAANAAQNLQVAQIQDREKAAAARIKPMPREQAMAILEKSPEDRFNAILAMQPEEVFGFFKTVRYNPNTSAVGADPAMRLIDGMSPLQKETLASLQGSNRMLGSEVLQSRLVRDVYSERQLEAVMTDFWLNHFNVHIGKNLNEVYTLPTWERNVIRKHALGKFEDLLDATAEAPAMLLYLDNYLSIGPHSKTGVRGQMYGSKTTGLNENYGRELMELHTLGVNGGYTQRDVTEVSKVFTGWTIERYGQAGAGFEFNEQRHEPGPKLVLGKVIQQNGQQEALDVLHMLATSPATAQFISKKLAVRFVSDNPPQSLVNAMAKTFLASNGDIKAVLRTMFHSNQFWAPEVYRDKLKTPIEYAVSAVRVSGAQMDNALPLARALQTLGMPLYGMQTPNGWSWKQDQWLNTAALVNRMNFALVLSTNRLPGVDINWDQVLGLPAPSNRVTPVSYEPGKTQIANKETALERVVLGFPASPQTRKTVLAQQDDGAARQAARDFKLGPGLGNGADNNGSDSAMAMMGANQQGKGGKGSVRINQRAMEAMLAQRKAPTDPQAATMAGLLLGSPEFQRR